MRWIILLTALGSPDFATDDLVATYGPLLDQCYEAAAPVVPNEGPHYDALSDGTESRRQCIGLLSNACMREEGGGYATPVMASCLRAETRMWDKYLHSEYVAAIDRMQASDKSYLPDRPEWAVALESLRAVQRSWIAYRDAARDFENAQWGNRPDGIRVRARCNLDMTANRTLELSIVSVMLASLADPADPMMGVWCAAGGGMMYVDVDGIDFDDHTVCDVVKTTGFAGADSWTSEISCQTYYLYPEEDDTLTVIDGHKTGPFQITITLDGPDRVSVDYGDGDPAQRFNRCD